jgi:hypothetical protein
VVISLKSEQNRKTEISRVRKITVDVVAMSPIDGKEFEAGSVNLKEEILTFLKTHKDNAYTADEIMNATSLQTNLDLEVAPKISVFIAANFVAFLNDLAADGWVRRKVVRNRMYFMAV